MYLSWHSNAGGGTGTDTFYDSSGPVSGSSSLAQSVHSNILEAIWDNHDSNWADRGVKTANFAEVNSSYNNEMPSILIELGFMTLLTIQIFYWNLVFDKMLLEPWLEDSGLFRSTRWTSVHILTGASTESTYQCSQSRCSDFMGGG